MLWISSDLLDKIINTLQPLCQENYINHIQNAVLLQFDKEMQTFFIFFSKEKNNEVLPHDE